MRSSKIAALLKIHTAIDFATWKFFLLFGYFTTRCFARRMLLLLFQFFCTENVVQPNDNVNSKKKHSLILLQFPALAASIRVVTESS